MSLHHKPQPSKLSREPTSRRLGDTKRRMSLVRCRQSAADVYDHAPPLRKHIFIDIPGRLHAHLTDHRRYAITAQRRCALSLSRASSVTSARGQVHREMNERLNMYLAMSPDELLPSAAKYHSEWPEESPTREGQGGWYLTSPTAVNAVEVLSCMPNICAIVQKLVPVRLLLLPDSIVVF